DKLLGGPQAGILTGKKEWISRLRRNPLFRALRVDKLTYAALGATLREYLLENEKGVPVLAMLAQTAAQIGERAERLLAGLDGVRGELSSGSSVLGGGSTPATEVPTTLLALDPPRGASATVCERRLRKGPTPLVPPAAEEP